MKFGSNSQTFGPFGVRDSGESSGVPAMKDSEGALKVVGEHHILDSLDNRGLSGITLLSRTTPNEVVKSHLTTSALRDLGLFVMHRLYVWGVSPLAARDRQRLTYGHAAVRFIKCSAAAADRLSAQIKNLLTTNNGS